MDEHRAQRVSEAIREELAEIIGYEMSDPRLAAVDVTEVLVTPDMRHARIRISVDGDEQECQEALQALAGARRLLRRELAGRVRLFRIPELHFETDLAGAGPARVEQLLKRVRKDRPKGAGAGEDPSK